MPPAKKQTAADILTVRVTILILLCTFLVGCKFPSLKVPRIYKVSVQQGNVITQEMVDKLKPGMTRSQVAYIMGEPILRNTFTESRWDYIYTITIPGYFEQDIRMSLFFEEDALSYFTGDLAPSGADPDAVEDESETATEDEPATS